VATDSKVREIGEENWRVEVLESSVPVLVDFYAHWCGPCRMMAPTLEKLSSRYGERIKVLKINTDEHQKLAMDYDIRALPTCLIFWAGEIAVAMTGLRNERQLSEALESVLDKASLWEGKQGAD
jgi:thioredoxin 1